MDAVHEADEPLDIGVCSQHNRVFECYCTQCYWYYSSHSAWSAPRVSCSMPTVAMLSRKSKREPRIWEAESIAQLRRGRWSSKRLRVCSLIFAMPSLPLRKTPRTCSRSQRNSSTSLSLRSRQGRPVFLRNFEDTSRSRSSLLIKMRKIGCRNRRSHRRSWSYRPRCILI